jgi:hypothetical protein
MFLTDHNEIADWLAVHFNLSQADFTINNDGSVNSMGYNGSVEIFDELLVRFDAAGSFEVTNCPITSLDGFPKFVKERFVLRSSLVTSLKGFPQYVGKSCRIQNNYNLTFEGLIPLLFVLLPSGITIGPPHQNSYGILNDGRDGAGRMDRALIPGKINQLRELDGTNT